MLKVILIDDEPLALRMLENLLKTYDAIEIVGAFTEYSDAVEQTDLNTIQAIFIDIELADINGIDVGRRLKKSNRDIDIVFVTSYEEYSIDAFEVNATDYLLKPVFEDRLDITIQRLMDKHGLKNDDIKNQKIRITCFEKFDVWEYNGEPVKWRTAKTKELAAFLVHHNGDFISKYIIIDTLWGSEQVNGHILYTTMSYLRSMFKKLGFDKVVVSKNSNYKIELKDIELDLIMFEQCLKESTIESMKKIVNLYKGDYCSREGYIWASTKRQYYFEKYQNTVKKLCDYFYKKQDYDKVISYARSFLEINPSEETIYKMLIKAYAKNK